MNRAGRTLAAVRYVFFCGLAVCTGIGPSAANGQARDTDASGQTTIHEIMDAWYARHDLVRSARFKFTEELVLMPGSQWGRGNRSQDDEGNRFPAEPLTLLREHEVVFDGILARHDRRGDDWHLRAEGPVPQHFVELSDGERELMYCGYEQTTDDIHPRAYVHPTEGESAGVFFGQIHEVLPIFITFRARHPAFNRPSGLGPFDASRYRLLDREGTIEGRRCLILDDIPYARRDQPHRIWVDPKRDFIVLRDEFGSGELVMFQVDAEYEQAESGTWIPMRWRVLSHAYHVDGGRVLRKSSTYAVTEHALNPAIDEAEFEFDPPYGTLGDDHSTGERELFVIRDEGVRPVTEDELLRGARYSDLLNTDSGEALLPPGQTSWRWTWLAVAVALGALGWLIQRRRTTGMRVFCALIALTGFSDNSANAQVAVTDPSRDITVQEIFDAWSTRHEQVHSARFNFTEERVLLPGSKGGRGDRRRDDGGNLFPAEPLTLAREHEVVFEGIKARRDRRGDDWHIRAERPVPEHRVNLTDGERDVAYYGFEERTVDEVHPQADISSAEGERAGVFIGQGHALLPIFISFRARHPGFTRPTAPGPYDSSRYRLLDREGTISGRRCLILDDIPNAEVGTPHRIWVDPGRDFIVLRNEAGIDNLVLFQLDIEYELDESGLWVPMRWTNLTHAQHVDGGRVLKETATFAVTEYALNPPIDDAEFEFEFPPGTFAQDFRSGEREIFLTRPGGVRPVTEDELLRGARYSDLLNTDSGEALLPPGQTSWRWTWLAVAIALAGFATLIWRRQ